MLWRVEAVKVVKEVVGIGCNELRYTGGMGTEGTWAGAWGSHVIYLTNAVLWPDAFNWTVFF